MCRSDTPTCLVQIAWPLIANFSCATSENCEKSDNMGWRYLLFALGGLSLFFWGLRFFVFTLFESPRFLSGIGKDAEAVEIIHKLARYNGKTTTLTVEELEAPGRNRDASPSRTRRNILSKDSKYGASHIKALFATPKMAWSTSLLIAVWGMHPVCSEMPRLNRFAPKGSLVLRRRSIIVFCLTCEWRCRYHSMQPDRLEGCPLAEPHSETDPFTPLTATCAFRAYDAGLHSHLTTTASDPEHDRCSLRLHCRMGRRGPVDRTQRQPRDLFRRVSPPPTHLHRSTTSRGIKRLRARSSTRAPPPGRRTSFWGGTVAMRFAATCVLGVLSLRQPNSYYDR